MLSKSDAAETGFQEPLKSQSEGKIYLSRFLRKLTLTSLIKRRIVKDRKSEQVSSQMQMWIPLQEIVTCSAARHKRKEEKREGEHLHFFSCRIMWVGGWVKERVTDPDLHVFVFVFVFVLLHVFLVIQNYVWECVVGSLIHLIKIGLDRWGAGDEKGEKFCVQLLQPMIRLLSTIGVLSRWNCLLILTWVRSPKVLFKSRYITRICNVNVRLWVCFLKWWDLKMRRRGVKLLSCNLYGVKGEDAECWGDEKGLRKRVSSLAWFILNIICCMLYAVVCC